jgi:hypothetical protein
LNNLSFAKKTKPLCTYLPVAYFLQSNKVNTGQIHVQKSSFALKIKKIKRVDLDLGSQKWKIWLEEVWE